MHKSVKDICNFIPSASSRKSLIPTLSPLPCAPSLSHAHPSPPPTQINSEIQLFRDRARENFGKRLQRYVKECDQLRSEATR
eukprot:29649-Amorphochlora_amoeboformis.AAC.2